nr:MAG TPA: hypothetical protein [Microviridae sp.]
MLSRQRSIIAKVVESSPLSAALQPRFLRGCNLGGVHLPPP